MEKVNAFECLLFQDTGGIPVLSTYRLRISLDNINIFVGASCYKVQQNCRVRDNLYSMHAHVNPTCDDGRSKSRMGR